MVSSKTVVATAVTSEIASANNLDYSFVDRKVVYINPRWINLEHELN